MPGPSQLPGQPQIPACARGDTAECPPVPACSRGIIPRAQQLHPIALEGFEPLWSSQDITQVGWSSFPAPLRKHQDWMGMGQHLLLPRASPFPCSRCYLGVQPGWAQAQHPKVLQREQIPSGESQAGESQQLPPCRAPSAQSSWHRQHRDISNPNHSRRSLWVLVEVLAEQFRGFGMGRRSLVPSLVSHQGLLGVGCNPLMHFS